MTENKKRLTPLMTVTTTEGDDHNEDDDGDDGDMDDWVKNIMTVTG